jgi:hypothetical protein
LPTEAIVGLFTLGGVALGFTGQWFLERARERRKERVAVSAVLFEMALLQSTLESAALERWQTRMELRKDFWDRYGADLANYLPQRLLKAMYLLYEDIFPSTKVAYGKLPAGIPEDAWPAFAAALLGWAYRAERLIQLVQEYRRESQLRLPLVGHRQRKRGEEDATEGFTSILDDLDAYATKKVQDHGLPTDQIIRMRTG